MLNAFDAGSFEEFSVSYIQIEQKSWKVDERLLLGTADVVFHSPREWNKCHPGISNTIASQTYPRCLGDLSL